MKKIILINLFMCLFLCVYSQKNESGFSEKDLHKIHLSQQVLTLKINVAGYSTTTINSLKEEYMAWKEKIISIDLEASTMVLTIKHNGLWQSAEIHEMLDKYNIPEKKILSIK
jgi:hypothetical protein